MRLIFLLLIISFAGQRAGAQAALNLGQSPPQLKWRQIRTQHFRVIFPTEIEPDAQLIANALDNAYYDVAASLHSTPRKIPIVMQNQTTDNNAFVSSEGRRAEFFSTPPQNPNNMGMNGWYEELSLHEYRHVVQMDQTRVGWGKVVFYLFGNSGTSVMQGLTNPWWFWEGDAVGCETTMGYGGRGRIPSFDLTFRTQLLSRGAFPYIKSACGSFRDAIPNHYLLGYLLTTYAKNHYGADVWSRILTHTYKTAPVPFSFSRSVKKITGLPVTGLYDSMTAELKQRWQQQLDSVKETAATIIHHSPDKVFVNYKFPQYLPDGSIVAEKSGLETGSFLAYKSSIVDQARFVVISKEGKESPLKLSGVLDDNGVMSAAGSKLTWTEYTYDPRWGARNYTVIKTLDAATRKLKQLTRRSRYHAPCFSPDGKMIAAMENTTGNKFRLVLLDAENGQVIRQYDNPGNIQYLQPRFSGNGRQIIMVRSVPGLKSIVQLDLATGLLKTILPPVSENISAPVGYRNFVLYNSPQTGIDNIYAVDTLTGHMYRVTSRKYGAFNPCISPDETQISFQDFTPDGFRIAVMPLNPAEWERLADPQKDDEKKVKFYQPLARQEAGNILAHIPDSVYRTEPYKRLRNAVKIFGWGIDPVTNLPKVSIGLRSVDMLSTTTLETGFEYDQNEKRFGKYFRVSYQGLYPQFFFRYYDGKRKTIFPENTGETTLSNLNYDLIRYRNYSGGMGLPLNFSKGACITKLNASAQLVYSTFSTYSADGENESFRKTRFGNLYYQQYEGVMDLRKRQSPRDVGPKAGTLLQFCYRNTAFKSYFTGSQTAADINIFLPGFFKHHATRLRFNWQQDENSNYHFENRYDFVRNQVNRLYHQWQLWSFDYKLPVCYPDKQVLGGLLYFQRIKADLFAERAKGRLAFPGSAAQQNDFTNIGVELTADVNLLRFLLPFDAGIRISHLLQGHGMNYSLMFRIPNLF